ncbi:MAG: sugar phosphate isomerase/epimerase [Clostridiales bacterium]|nr:sugar phosphate isomerase/epimerase [Clostridiales bacterium]
MNIGCHCVLFGPAIATDTDGVLGALAESGCKGVELGARFFGIDRHVELKEALERHGLMLAGLHTAVPLIQLLDHPEESLKTMAAAAKSLEDMPVRNIIMTGNVENRDQIIREDARLADAGSVKELAAKVDEIAAQIKDGYGVQIHYHNHSWEFQNNGLIYRTLLSETEHLLFCLDTGWAATAGQDPVELIQQNPGRFQYLHLRDYNRAAVKDAADFKQMQERAFTELGEGDMGYQRLAGCVRKAVGAGGWAVIEYERGEVNALRYVKAVAYLKGVLAGIG